METCIQSTQKDGKLTADQALVKQAWERLSAGVRYTIDLCYFYMKLIIINILTLNLVHSLYL